MHRCTDTQIHRCIDTLIHRYIDTYVRTYIHAWMHACMYTNICVLYLHIHTLDAVTILFNWFAGFFSIHPGILHVLQRSNKKPMPLFLEFQQSFMVKLDLVCWARKFGWIQFFFPSKDTLTILFRSEIPGNFFPFCFAKCLRLGVMGRLLRF